MCHMVGVSSYELDTFDRYMLHSLSLDIGSNVEIKSNVDIKSSINMRSKWKSEETWISTLSTWSIVALGMSASWHMLLLPWHYAFTSPLASATKAKVDVGC